MHPYNSHEQKNHIADIARMDLFHSCLTRNQMHDIDVEQGQKKGRLLERVMNTHINHIVFLEKGDTVE